MRKNMKELIICALDGNHDKEVFFIFAFYSYY